MTHQQLLELHVAAKALAEEIKEGAGLVKPGKYKLSNVRVIVDVREALVQKNADGLAAPTPKINWLLMTAFLLSKASDPDGAKKKLLAFAAKTLEAGEPGPLAAAAADLEEEFDGIKEEVKKKLPQEHRNGACTVKPLGCTIHFEEPAAALS